MKISDIERFLDERDWERLEDNWREEDICHRPKVPDPYWDRLDRETQLDLKSIRNGHFVQEIREDIYLALGDECATCGSGDRRVFHIDHVNGGGSKDRERYGTGYKYYKHIRNLVYSGKPHNYQLLCANCNWIKRETHGEIRRRGDE